MLCFSKGFEFPMGSAGIISGVFLQLQSPRIHSKAGAPLTCGQIADKYMVEAKVLSKNRESSDREKKTE